jgi:hypothetical protein
MARLAAVSGVILFVLSLNKLNGRFANFDETKAVGVGTACHNLAQRPHLVA